MTASPAFIVARAMRGGVHTFAVYLEPDRIGFIRLGTGPGIDYAVAAQGGLIGWLLGRWISAARKKRQRLRAEENRSKTLDEMLAQHRVNHAIPVADISDVSLEPGGWTLKKGSVNWRFQWPGEKKRTLCTLRDVSDTTAAINLLPRIFPDMRIEVQRDDRTGMYIKPTAASTPRGAVQ